MNIKTVTIEHKSPGYGMHRNKMSRAYPECICHKIRAVFTDGAVTFEVLGKKAGIYGDSRVTVLDVTS